MKEKLLGYIEGLRKAFLVKPPNKSMEDYDRGFNDALDCVQEYLGGMKEDRAFPHIDRGLWAPLRDRWPEWPMEPGDRPWEEVRWTCASDPQGTMYAPKK